MNFPSRQQQRKDAELQAAARQGGIYDDRTLQWANYAGQQQYPGDLPFDAIPVDPRDPGDPRDPRGDKDLYSHSRMHPNDYGLRHHHIYESPNFT